MLQSLASTRQGGGIAICGILAEGDESGVTPNIMYGANKGILLNFLCLVSFANEYLTV